MIANVSRLATPFFLGMAIIIFSATVHSVRGDYLCGNGSTDACAETGANSCRDETGDGCKGFQTSGLTITGCCTSTACPDSSGSAFFVKAVTYFNAWTRCVPAWRQGSCVEQATACQTWDLYRSSSQEFPSGPLTCLTKCGTQSQIGCKAGGLNPCD